jgi:hypothetical protein
MVIPGTARMPASVSVDLDRGGRWTSLRLGGREWLWHREEPRRDRVTPGDPFADAGGIEECVPTIRGVPDHGDAWSRAWRDLGGGTAEVRCRDFALRRQIIPGDNGVRARYQLDADPGYRFVWAAHALLDVSPAALLEVPGSPGVRLYPEAAPFVTVSWPGPAGLRLDRLGPDDGSAAGAIIEDCAEAVVRDGAALRMSLHAGGGLPVSVALWRNLGGFPSGHPYRSIGVEPMLGSVFDLADACGDGDAVTVPADGRVEWELEMEMTVS